jgi:hypothetical protein
MVAQPAVTEQDIFVEPLQLFCEARVTFDWSRNSPGLDNASR